MKFGIKTFILKINKLKRVTILQNNKKISKIDIQHVEGEVHIPQESFENNKYISEELQTLVYDY